MVHTTLDYGVAFSKGPRKHLGIDKGTGTFHLNVIKNFPLVQFKRAIDITNVHIKNKIDKNRQSWR